jgi:hypothetical protein
VIATLITVVEQLIILFSKVNLKLIRDFYIIGIGYTIGVAITILESDSIIVVKCGRLHNIR